MIRAPRTLTFEEIEALLALDVPARRATVDSAGFPPVTPPAAPARSAARSADERVVIRLRPHQLLGVASL